MGSEIITGDDILGAALDEFSGAGNDFSSLGGGEDLLGALLMGQGDDSAGVADLMGGDDILGELLMGARQGGNPRARMMRQLLAQRLARQGTMVRPTKLTKAREYPLGFVSLAIAAGATVDVTSNPQIRFRGERLVIPSTLVAIGTFLVQDIKVGNVSQFPASGALPASTFSELGVGVRLQLDTADPAINVVLRITNGDVVPRDFRATIIGSAVQ
jgi:hypothetical protein